MIIEIGNNLKGKPTLKCGNGQYPCIISSFGISDASMSYAEEIKKAKAALQVGANIVNDNSLDGDIDYNYECCIKQTAAVFGFVAINGFANDIHAHKDIRPIEFINRLKGQMELGADIITLHASIWAGDWQDLQSMDRIIPYTSRGGALLIKYMRYSGHQNPYFTYFDNILQAAKKYNVTLSLCVSSRAASIEDYLSHNEFYWVETKRVGELVKRAQTAGVNVVVEGIGHCPLHCIADSIRKTKDVCYNAPYRVMSVCTDIALGMDHLSSAISAATAVASGADMVTCITRAEHIGLPDLSDITEAVRYTKLAIHIGYSARTGHFVRDMAMALERRKKGCGGEVNHAIDKVVAKRELLRHKFQVGQKKCTMCGDNCALKLTDELIEGNESDGK